MVRILIDLINLWLLSFKVFLYLRIFFCIVFLALFVFFLTLFLWFHMFFRKIWQLFVLTLPHFVKCNIIYSLVVYRIIIMLLLTSLLIACNSSSNNDNEYWSTNDYPYKTCIFILLFHIIWCVKTIWICWLWISPPTKIGILVFLFVYLFVMIFLYIIFLFNF